MAVITVNTRTAATATGNIARTIAIAIGTKDCKSRRHFRLQELLLLKKVGYSNRRRALLRSALKQQKVPDIFSVDDHLGICDAAISLIPHPPAFSPRRGNASFVAAGHPPNHRGTAEIITA